MLEFMHHKHSPRLSFSSSGPPKDSVFLPCVPVTCVSSSREFQNQVFLPGYDFLTPTKQMQQQFFRVLLSATRATNFHHVNYTAEEFLRIIDGWHCNWKPRRLYWSLLIPERGLTNLFCCSMASKDCTGPCFIMALLSWTQGRGLEELRRALGSCKYKRLPLRDLSDWKDGPSV